MQESNFLKPSDLSGLDQLSIEILDEVVPVNTSFGVKNQGKVKVTNGKESHDKTMSFNQPFINFLVGKYGKDSKSWIGKKIEITTKTIKNNLAIVPLTP
jgi:hypothetical protein